MQAIRFKEEINFINASEAVYIYGGGDVAREVAYCLCQKPFSKEIKAFLVSDIKAQTEKTIMERPIISYAEADKKTLIVVAVLEKYKNEIECTLIENGYTNYLFLTYESDLWCEIRKIWFLHNCKNLELPIETLESRKTLATFDEAEQKQLKIYVAKSPYDKELKNKAYNQAWEVDIQVGRALTDQQVAVITDLEGDNISEKNKQYCEMTALYWLWKHATEDYIGLCHYRRHFDLKQDDIKKICGSAIDIVLTTPIINVPSVKYMYEKNHIASDWKVFGDAIDFCFPDYREEYDRLSKEKIYIPYNMVIMRKEVLGAYCEWAFSIFKYIEDHTPKREEDTYQRRNIGFLSERVMTVYLLHHWHELDIVLADKIFYE